MKKTFLFFIFIAMLAMAACSPIISDESVERIVGVAENGNAGNSDSGNSGTSTGTSSGGTSDNDDSSDGSAKAGSINVQVPTAPERNYRPTTVTGTETLDLSLGDGETAIIGGYIVDGVENGVYKMVCGPKDFSVTITDGFASIVDADTGDAEFDSRLAQAEAHGWDREHISRDC